MARKVTVTRKQLLAYILDELPAGERKEVEMAYFASPKVLHALQGLTETMIDHYLNRTMSASLRARFERALKKKPALRKKIDLARHLRRASD